MTVLTVCDALQSWVGLAGTVESTPQPSVGSLINETRDLAASVLGTVGS
jgi:hypothetical protein